MDIFHLKTLCWQNCSRKSDICFFNHIFWQQTCPSIVLRTPTNFECRINDFLPPYITMTSFPMFIIDNFRAIDNTVFAQVSNFVYLETHCLFRHQPNGISLTTSHHCRESHPQIADIFAKKGPFLKLYSSYMRNFENANALLDEACKKYPAFQSAVKDFEASLRQTTDKESLLIRTQHSDLSRQFLSLPTKLL